MKFVVLGLLAALVGCSSTKPNPTNCLDGHCNDPDLPFCDVDGAIGGEPNTCINVECTPNEFEACRGDNAVTCNGTGDNFDLVACEFGCGATGCNPCNTSACEKHIIPRYLPNICDTLAEGDPVTISSPLTLDTSNPLNCHSVMPQVGGPEICVFKRSAITVAANQTVRVVGSRAIAFVADRDLKVEGVIDVSAEQGPGVLTGAHGPGGGTISGALGDTATGTGGGGAGYQTAGGGGGTRGGGIVMNGGAAQPGPVQLAYLTGGTAPPRTGGVMSGFAGGAVTLISCRGTVFVEGLIDAAGGGGGGGYRVQVAEPALPAGGGGSGGTVVIQGMNVTITGQLFANGGGGGAGEDPNQLDHQRGSAGGKGGRSTAFASGGTGQTGGGSGGNGGSSSLPAGAGVAPSDNSHHGGAGGGSVGYLQTHTPSGIQPMLTPSATSPQLQGNQTIPTN